MRLFPRFSLRLAWIVLTIFLIVFAVVVNYYQRYHAHERIAVQLQNENCDVEEEPISLVGFVIGKRLTGIQVQTQSDVAYLELLETLPRPHELRRFGYNVAIPNQENIVRLLAAIQRFTELEELHLHCLTFTEEQALFLGRLPKLRVLDLTRCNLPAGSLQLLAKSPHLETLVLDEAVCDSTELLEVDLPRLRKLSMNSVALTYLELTKRGWGRFPLETLVMRQNNLSSINTEAGALPQLKHLDLGNVGYKCQIDWNKIPAAMPELTLLAAPTPWLTPKVIPELAALTKLRYLYFDGALVHPQSSPQPAIDPFAAKPYTPTENSKTDSETKPVPDPFANNAPPTTENSIPEVGTKSAPDLFSALVQQIAESAQNHNSAEPPFETNLTLVEGGGQTVHGPSSISPFAPLDLKNNPDSIPASVLPAIKELLQKRPDLLFTADYDAVRQMLDPMIMPRSQPSMWPSPNWRPNPNNQGGIF